MDISDATGGTTRRSFLRSACLMGFCACAAPNAKGEAGAHAESEGERPPAGMPRKWIATLLPLMATIDPDEARRILKRCSSSHYEDLAMDETVSRFHGDVSSFVDFLRTEWGWIVDFDPVSGVVVVNENKVACVCPLISPDHGSDLGMLCSCSEGFAERMFSAITGAPVRAEVTESILRGGERCRYRIELKARRA